MNTHRAVHSSSFLDNYKPAFPLYSLFHKSTILGGVMFLQVHIFFPVQLWSRSVSVVGPQLLVFFSESLNLFDQSLIYRIVFNQTMNLIQLDAKLPHHLDLKVDNVFVAGFSEVLQRLMDHILDKVHLERGERGAILTRCLCNVLGQS